MTFDEWWDKEGRDIFQRAEGWLVAQAAWNAARLPAGQDAKDAARWRYLRGPKKRVFDMLDEELLDQEMNAAPQDDCHTSARSARAETREVLNQREAALPAGAAPVRWNPNTSSMEPYTAIDDMGLSKK